MMGQNNFGNPMGNAMGVNGMGPGLMNGGGYGQPNMLSSKCDQCNKDVYDFKKFRGDDCQHKVCDACFLKLKYKILLSG